MTEHHDHRDDCPFKFATLDACDCVEKNMLDRVKALTKERDAYARKLMQANKRGDAWRFRADIAEVKLAKAVEALSDLMMHEPDYPDTIWEKSRATLAEIKRREP